MRVRAFPVACVLAVCVATALPAQDAPLDGIEIRPSGQAYADAIRFQRINAEVGYFDPTRPAPELDTSETPRAAPDLDGGSLFEVAEGVRISTILICAVLLLGLAYIVVVFGGRLPVSFSRTPEDGSAPAGQGRGGGDDREDAAPMGLRAILRMTDKREALVALCKSLLARSVAAQGVLFQRSWTDREALRRVPADFEHREALRALVLASEKVQFGGRDVTEAEFEAHVASVRPLWSGGGA
ncbi:MAG: DUF4129 domain-containing protein [Pseudomonadota bacterium]